MIYGSRFQNLQRRHRIDKVLQSRSPTRQPALFARIREIQVSRERLSVPVRAGIPRIGNEATNGCRLLTFNKILRADCPVDHDCVSSINCVLCSQYKFDNSIPHVRHTESLAIVKKAIAVRDDSCSTASNSHGPC